MKTNHKKKLAFICIFDKLAGTETAAINLLQNLVCDYNIDLYVIDNNMNIENYLDSNLKSNLNNIYFYNQKDLYQGMYPSWKNYIRFWNKKKSSAFLKQINFNYDTVINFSEGLGFIFKKIKCNNTLTWNHFDLSKSSQIFYDSEAKFLNSYKYADKIVSVSKLASDYFKKYQELSKHSYYVHNIIDSKNVITKSKLSYDKNVFDKEVNFIYVARIEASKNHKMVIQASKELAKHGFNHKVVFIGKEKNKKFLDEFNQLIENNNVDNNLKYLGILDNPFPYIKNASCFLLCSFYEGYPMSMLEALCLNTPIITTKSGAEEVIEFGKYGQVIETNVESIKTAMLNYNKIQKMDSNFETKMENNYLKCKQIIEGC